MKTIGIDEIVNRLMRGRGRLITTIAPDPLADDSNDANNPRLRMEYDAAGRKVDWNIQDNIEGLSE
jgi:YD repeat-containing protein